MMKKWMAGHASDESERMTMREEKIRETYELDSIEDPLISQVMLEVAQHCVEAMDKDVVGLRERFARTS